MAFKISVDVRAQVEIEKAIAELNKVSKKSAKKLFSEIENSYRFLSINPFYQIRYKQIRCLPLKKFPYMFHFSVSEKKNW
jgi:toxin ParE1/3/4